MKELWKAPFRRSLAAIAAVVIWVPPLRAAAADSETGNDAMALPSYVVVATRTPHAPSDVPVSVSVLKPSDWERTQIPDLASLLRRLPGVSVVGSGATGAQTSLFMRGAASDQTLFLVDGVRMNDRSAFYQNYLGAADLANVGRVEVVRGPESVLYGGSAMGGVVSIETARGEGPPSLRVDASAGSFSTVDGSAAFSGSSGGLGYSASLSRFRTANERPDNDFGSTSWSARFDWSDPKETGLELGVTTRGMESTYNEPGTIGPFPFPGVVKFDQTLATAFARYRSGPVRARLILAAQKRRYEFTSSYGSTPIDGWRRIVDLQVTADASDTLELTAGAYYEPSRQETPGDLKKERLKAGFLSAFWKPEENTAFVLGVRQDDYDSIGGHGTWRAGLAHTVASSGTTFRAAFGSAFTAPSLDDRYGNAAFFQPASPDIRPEVSDGWEAGIAQALARGKGRISATWFSNRFRDLFSYDPDTYATINVGRATSRGVEVTGEFKPRDDVRIVGGYTWTEAVDSSDGSQLPRRPRHSGSLDVEYDATPAITVGAGLLWVGGRVDVGPVDLTDYATVRVHASWQVTKQVRANVRIENLLDRRYEEIQGYPALGFGVFGGITFQF